MNIVLNSPEDGRLRPKHVAKCNLIVIIASCLDVCCVLTVHNILCNLIIHKGVASQKKSILALLAHIPFHIGKRNIVKTMFSVCVRVCVCVEFNFDQMTDFEEMWYER